MFVVSVRGFFQNESSLDWDETSSALLSLTTSASSSSSLLSDCWSFDWLFSAALALSFSLDSSIYPRVSCRIGGAALLRLLGDSNLSELIVF